MIHIKILLLILLGLIGVWLFLWDIIDFLTTGFNEGIWNWGIIQSGFPSIAIGFCIILVVSFLGVSVIRG